MAAARKIGQLAAAGSTGNNTHASVAVPADIDALALEFEVTAVGTTITPAFQGSLDDAAVPDATSDWFPLEVLPHDAVAETPTPAARTAVGIYPYSVRLMDRPLEKVRLVTSANTGVTYEAEAYGLTDVG